MPGIVRHASGQHSGYSAADAAAASHGKPNFPRRTPCIKGAHARGRQVPFGSRGPISERDAPLLRRRLTAASIF